MKRALRNLVTAWPYATILCCFFIWLAFLDGHDREWGWTVADAVAAATWFLVAHHFWEQT